MPRRPNVRFVRRLFWTAAPVAAVFLWVGLSLPPESRDLAGMAEADPSSGSVVRGVFHVHTSRSDGSGSVDEVAAAARVAGLDFVIVTDHGDGTRGAEASYRRGVLVIEAVEISTGGGHYIAVGMPAAPYPLGGDARGVVEDVHRLGGFGVVAHPTSPRRELRWTDWSLPVDAVEWINGDSQWRDDGTAALLGVAARYWFRPEESLASLLSRPVDALAHWDAAAQRRPTVGVAGTDAHARLATGAGDDRYTDGLTLRVPSYETLFRAYGLRVELTGPFTGDAVGDARHLVAQLEAGRVYTAVDAVARPPRFSYSGTHSEGRRARMGESVSSDQQPLALTATVAAPDDATLRLLRNGKSIAETVGRSLVYEVAADAGPAAYRVEVHLAMAPGEPPVPWIVSNPIYTTGAPAELAPVPALARGRPLDVGRWRAEQSADADVAFRADERGVELVYQLGADAETYAAGVYDLEAGALGANAMVEFTALATPPMRASLQLRQGGDADIRWRHSFYAGATPRRVRLSIDEFQAVSPAVTPQPVSGVIDGLLLVVDTVNLSPGAAGTIRIEDVEIGTPD